MDKTNKFYLLYLIGFFLILALPLLAVPPWFSPPAWGKTIVFRVILSVLIFFFIWQILKGVKGTEFLNLRNSVPLKLVLGILILLLFLFLLSTIFSPEKHFSFWGNPYRAGGFLNFSFYVIFAVLVFLILKPRDWKLIWNFSLGIALLVSLIALLQQFKAFKEFLVLYSVRPPATLGSAISLALYLSFFVFLSLSFALSEKNRKKKILYLLSFLIIIFVIFLTGTRAVFLGLTAAFLYFILFYPKKLIFLKIAILVFLTLGILGVYYLNTHSEKISSYPLVSKNQVLTTLLYRFNIKLFLEDPRFSFWKIAANSLEERPFLGYGPENFSIAFDKYYDPSLSYIGYRTVGQVDRAHNFIFETAVTVGIPALIIFLLLFSVLLWQLQKIKKAGISPEKTIISHGVQATIIAYFGGLFFSFDTFDTYLIFFLVIGYCLYLISSSRENLALNQNKEYRHRKIIISLLFLLLLFFVWFYNLKPLFINKETNWADYYATNGKCQKAIDKMEKVLPSQSIINHYVMLRYSDVLKECQKTNPEKEKELVQKSIQILEKAAKLRPTYTRTWILLGIYYNLFVEANNEITPEVKEKLLQKADYSFNRAHELNPKRQSVFVSWVNTDLLSKKYQKAKEKSEECINLNPEFGDCWWTKGLSDVFLGNIKEAQEDIKTAGQKGFNINSKIALSQLLKTHLVLIKNYKDIEYYRPLIDIYKKLIEFEPNNFQYYASLAYTYKVLGEYQKAREAALTALKLSPESRQNVEEFLRTLPQK